MLWLSPNLSMLPVRWSRLVATPGVLAIQFHDMRHTHGTLLLESGETVVYVAERLGDTVETVVETYAHVTPTMRATAPARLAALLRSRAKSEPSGQL